LPRVGAEELDAALRVEELRALIEREEGAPERRILSVPEQLGLGATGREEVEVIDV